MLSSNFRNIGKLVKKAHPKVIEAFYSFYSDSPPENKQDLLDTLKIKESYARKRISKMTTDEIMLYWGVLGGRVHLVYEDKKKGMNYKSIQQLMKTIIAQQRSKEKALSGDYIHVYATKEDFKYIDYLSDFLNSKWNLSKKDYKYLARNPKARKEIADFEEYESDYALFFKILTSSSQLANYLQQAYEMDMQESYVLQLIASKMGDKNISYQFLSEKTATVMSKIRLERSFGKLITKRLIHSYGEKQDRTFIITSSGMEVINNAFEYAIKTF